MDTKGDTYAVAELLVEEQPRNEEDYLRLVLDFEPNHSLWLIVTEYQFCDNSVNSLAKQIYKTRNELAHAKDKWATDIPHLFSGVEELSRKLTVFRAVAKAALLKFGGVTL